MKNSYYFDHDYNSRNDQKILIVRAKYGARGYGVFWMLIEMMAESTMPHLNLNHIPAIAVAINEDPEWLKEFIGYCIDEAHLFVCDGLSFANHRLIRHKIFRESFVEYGEKGANARWNKISPPNAPPISPPNAKEIKEIKESKEKDLDTFFSYFNLKTKKAFKLTPAAKDLITKRLKEGYTLEQLKKAVDNFVLDDWPERQNRLDLIYCIGRQRGKPDNLEKWLNYKPTPKVIKPC